MVGAIIGELAPVKPWVDCWWTVRRSDIWGWVDGGLGDLNGMVNLELDKLGEKALTSSLDSKQNKSEIK
jgi:hypothetical protein